MGINEIAQIGNQIRKIRNEKGLTQKEVSKLAGISYSTYSNYENNNREPNLSQLEKIANALGCEVSDIYEHDFRIKYELTPERLEKARLDAEVEKLIQKKSSGENITADEQKKIDDYIERISNSFAQFPERTKELKNKIDKIGENILLSGYRELNTEGQSEARKRVSELTEIPRYTKKDKDKKEENTVEFSEEFTPTKDYLLPNAAHADESLTEITEEMIQAEEDIMDDINFGKT